MWLGLWDFSVFSAPHRNTKTHNFVHNHNVFEAEDYANLCTSIFHSNHVKVDQGNVPAAEDAEATDGTRPSVRWLVTEPVASWPWWAKFVVETRPDRCQRAH